MARHRRATREEDRSSGRDWFDWGTYVVHVAAILGMVVLVGLPVAYAIFGPFMPGSGDSNSFVGRVFDVAVTVALGPLGSDRFQGMPGLLWFWALYWFGLIAGVFGFAWLMRRTALWLTGTPERTSEDDRGN